LVRNARMRTHRHTHTNIHTCTHQLRFVRHEYGGQVGKWLVEVQPHVRFACACVRGVGNVCAYNVSVRVRVSTCL